jgi:hypothetical protein
VDPVPDPLLLRTLSFSGAIYTHKEGNCPSTYSIYFYVPYPNIFLTKHTNLYSQALLHFMYAQIYTASAQKEQQADNEIPLCGMYSCSLDEKSRHTHNNLALLNLTARRHFEI